MTDEQEIIDDIIRIVRGRLSLPVIRRRLREKLEVYRNAIFWEDYEIPPPPCVTRNEPCVIVPVEEETEA